MLQTWFFFVDWFKVAYDLLLSVVNCIENSVFAVILLLGRSEFGLSWKINLRLVILFLQIKKPILPSHVLIFSNVMKRPTIIIYHIQILLFLYIVTIIQLIFRLELHLDLSLLLLVNFLTRHLLLIRGLFHIVPLAFDSALCVFLYLMHFRHVQLEPVRAALLPILKSSFFQPAIVINIERLALLVGGGLLRGALLVRLHLLVSVFIQLHQLMTVLPSFQD